MQMVARGSLSQLTKGRGDEAKSMYNLCHFDLKKEIATNSMLAVLPGCKV